MADVAVQTANRLASIGKLMKAQALTQVVGSLAHDTCRAINALENGVDEQGIRSLQFGDELWEHFYNETVERAANKKRVRQDRFQINAQVRATYLPTSSLTIQAGKSTGRPYWRFHMNLDSSGLMTHIAQHEGHDISKPIALQLFNQLPHQIDKKGKTLPVRHEVNGEEFKFLAEEGYQVSKGKVAWRWDVVKDLCVKSLPSAIDFCAYNHRLRSPLVPGGFFHSQDVLFKDKMTLRVEDTTENMLREAVGLHDELTLEEDELMGADGSGTYNCNHPLLASFISQYGATVIQLTVLNKDGLFAKGILEPREGPTTGDDSPWQFDHLMAKGFMKDFHKPLHGTGQTVTHKGCYIGIMKTWSKKAKMPAGFEQFENVGPAKRPNESFVEYLKRKQEVINDVKSLTQDGMARLFKGGVDRLLASVANDDPNLKTIIDFINRAREYERDLWIESGKDVEAFKPSLSAMQIPMVGESVDDRLQNKLWVCGQGAGVEGRQLVIIIDASLEEGTCVVRGVRPGTMGAVWRFPTITSCGLVTAEAMEPKPHHMIKGKIIDNTLFMNPKDVLKFQGDDDGDIVGYSTDPRIVRLWENRLDNVPYSIEPEGEKFDLETDSPGGWQYTNYDPRGPVGICTIAISKLRAVGDHDAALGAAVLNQEAIDSAKKSPKYTDWEKASNRSNWRLCEDGWHHIHWFVSDGKFYANSTRTDDMVVTQESDHWYGEASEFPIDEFSTWVNSRLTASGCTNTKDIRQNPLGWRIQQKPKKNESGEEYMVKVRKRIVPSTWEACNVKQAGWLGGNWVHYIHDIALEMWTLQESEFLDGKSSTLQLQDLVPNLLKTMGVQVEVPVLTWKQYLEVRANAGLVEFGKELNTVLSKVHDQDERNQRINSATANLNHDLSKSKLIDLVTIWVYEHTPRWSFKVNKMADPQYTTNRGDVPAEITSYQVNKPNHAFRAVTHPKSEVMTLLGIEPEDKCGYLDEQAKTADTRLEAVVNYCFKTNNPYETMAKMVYGDLHHGQYNKGGNGESVELHECEHCRSELQNALVRRVRNNRRAAETLEMRELVSALGTKPRMWSVGAAVQTVDYSDDGNQDEYEYS